MTAFEFVLLLFNEVPGQRIEGRTKLQKVAHFFGLHLGMGGVLGYRAHYYGPYSAEAADAASMLVSLGFLNETVPSGTLEGQGFERRKYVYALTEEGKEAATVISRHAEPGFIDRLQDAVRELHAVIESDYVPLSFAAKVLWITKGRLESETERIQENAETVGWKLDDDQVTDARGFLNALNERGFHFA